MTECVSASGSSASRKFAFLGGAVLAGALLCRCALQRVVVPAGFSAVVFSRSRCLVYRVVEGADSRLAEGRRFFLPVFDHDATFALLPSSLLIDTISGGNGGVARSTRRSGVEVDVVAHGVRLSGSDRSLSVTVRVGFGVKQVELGRYLSLHEAGQPHARVAEVASAAIEDAVRKLGRVDEEALLSAGRRERCFDDSALSAVRDAVWANAAVRVLAVSVVSVKASDES